MGARVFRNWCTRSLDDVTFCRHKTSLLEISPDFPPLSDDQITEQKYFTDGRIVVFGKKHLRKPGNHILFYKPNFAIAVVEAKAAYKNPGDGLKQVMDYAEILKLKFAYSTNYQMNCGVG